MTQLHHMNTTQWPSHTQQHQTARVPHDGRTVIFSCSNLIPPLLHSPHSAKLIPVEDPQG